MYLVSRNREELKSMFIKFIAVAAVIMLAIYIAKSIVVSGKVRVRILALSVPFLILWVQRLSDQAKFRLVLMAIFLVPLQLPKLPFSFTLSELILLVIAFLQLPILQLGAQKASRSTIKVSVLIPYGIFVLGGLIGGIINGGLGTWHVVCLIPLVWMYVATRLVNSPEDALKLIRAALISVLGCLFIIWLANLTGNVVFEYTAGGWRMGCQVIVLGPIKYTFWSTTFGTMIALVFPTVTILLLRKDESAQWQLFYRLLFILFVFLLLKSAARGATIAAFVGMVLIFVFLIRPYSSKVIATGISIILVVIILGGPLGAKLVFFFNLEHNLERFDTMFADPLGVANLQYRIGVLALTIRNTIENPLGYGFRYLFTRYGIDEAILYSALLNGTGIMGVIGFVLIVGQLFRHFVINLVRKPSEQQRELAALGIGTLACGLVAGIASQSVMLGSIHSFVFWTILAACYSGTCGIRHSITENL